MPRLPQLPSVGVVRAASGIHPLEAGTSLQIDCGYWLDREDLLVHWRVTGTRGP